LSADRLAIVRKFDIRPRKEDKQTVKVAKPVAEKKTPGTLIVEKYRPRMNKLTPAERRQLRQRAGELMRQP
jgi:hypothetical protein